MNSKYINSYGIICLKFNNSKLINIFKLLNSNNINNNIKPINIKIINFIINNTELLLVKKKYTLYFIELIKGNYNPDNIKQIMFLLNNITLYELNMIKLIEFKEIWIKLFNKVNKQYKIAENKFKKIFNIILQYEKINNHDNLWEIPKGKLDENDNTNLNCALREFYEETQIKDIQINNFKYTMHFIGTNGKYYNYIYYLGMYTKNRLYKSYINSKEIDNIAFFKLRDILNNKCNCIRINDIKQLIYHLINLFYYTGKVYNML